MKHTNLLYALSKLIVALRELDQTPFSFEIVSGGCFRREKKRSRILYFQFGLIYGVTIYLCGGMFHLPLLFPSNKFSTWKTHTHTMQIKTALWIVVLNVIVRRFYSMETESCYEQKTNATFCKQKLDPVTINYVFRMKHTKKSGPRRMNLVHFIGNFWHWKLIRYETINGFRWSSIWQFTAYRRPQRIKLSLKIEWASGIR